MLDTKKVIEKAKASGLKKTEFCEKIGISLDTLDKWSRGEKAIYPALTGIICKTLECTEAELSAEVPTPVVMPEPTSAPVADEEENVVFDAADETIVETPDEAPVAETEPVKAEAPAPETKPVEVKPVEKPAPAPKKPAVKKPEAKKPVATGKGKVVAPQLFDAIKATRFNTKDVKKNDLDSAVDWLNSYAKELKTQATKNIDILMGAIREINLERKLEKVNLSPQALDVAARFDKLTEGSKTALLTILAGLK